MKTNTSLSKSGRDVPAGVSTLSRSDLESLVDELIKNTPNEDRVRKQMLAAGLNYSKDPIERMSLVLQAIEDAKPIATSAKPSVPPEKGNKRRERDHVQDL